MGYVVKQRWLSGKGKKFFESGDVVTERDFPENFQELIREGRIEYVEDGSTSGEDENLKKALASIDPLYLERKLKLMPFWEVLKHKEADFSAWSEETFEIVLKEAENDFNESEAKKEAELENEAHLPKELVDEAKKALELQNESNADKKLTVVLTQEDFDRNPDLAEQGLKVGDTVELDVQEEKANEGENLDPKKPIFHFDPEGENRPIFSDEDLNKEELIRHLMNNGIAFKANEGKAKLWEKAITPIAE